MFFSGIKCDHCGQHLVFSHTAQKWITRFAREKGWTVGKTATCPDCIKKRKVRNETNN